jgi:hypothetical protein
LFYWKKTREQAKELRQNKRKYNLTLVYGDIFRYNIKNGTKLGN